MNADTTSPRSDAGFDPVNDAENWNTLESNIREWESSAPKSVLLIGEDDDATENFAQAIGDAGFSCRTCNSGSEALRSTRSETFPLVAIRRGLPDVGGEDLSKILRAHNLPEAEFILLEAQDAHSAATEVEKAHSKRIKDTRKRKFYGEKLGGALFSGLNRLKNRNQRADQRSQELHADFRQELEKLARSDSEYLRDESVFKSYLADSLDEDSETPPERLLERAIQAVRDLNEKQTPPKPQ